MRNNSKGVIQILIPIILALIVLAGIGYFALKNRQSTPSSSNSSTTLTNTGGSENWNIYKDNKLGMFEFKYPKNWYADSESPSHFVQFSSAPYKDFIYGKLPNGNTELILQVVYRNKSIPLNDYAIMEETPNTTKQEVYRKNSLVAGKKAVEIDYIDKNQNETGKVIYISTDNFVSQTNVDGTISLKFPEGAEIILLLRFYYYSNDTRKEYYNQTLNQILSTFKFLDPGLFNWKIHTDVKYGFEFRYPEAWNDFGSGDSSGYFKTDSNNTLNLTIYTDSSKTITEYLQNKDKLSETSYEGSPAYQVQSTKKTTINGLSCIQRTEYLYAADITTLATYFKNKNYIVSLTLVPTPGNTLEQDRSYYNQILSTFKFLDQENTPTESPESIQIQM